MKQDGNQRIKVSFRIREERTNAHTVYKDGNVSEQNSKRVTGDEVGSSFRM